MNAFRLVAASVLVLALAGCGSDQGMVMPDVTGKKLDVALSEIESAGFSDDVDISGGGILGIVIKSNWQVCEQSPAAGESLKDAPRLTVDRSCGEGSPAPKVTEPEADSYVYEGPRYEVITVDENQTQAKLNQHWVLTGEIDYSTDAYKDQVKMIISDIAHAEGTDKFLVEVVTDKEIAQAESPSTFETFVTEHGTDYAINEIPKKEKTGWVASYTGGFDYDAGEPSESADAFEVIWRPYSTSEIEKWRPQPVG